LHESRRDLYLILLALAPLLLFLLAFMNWRSGGERTVAIPGINVKVPRVPAVDKVLSRVPVDAINPVAKDASTQTRVTAIAIIIGITIAAIVVFFLLLDLFGFIRKSLFPEPPDDSAAAPYTDAARDSTFTRS
jgi:hypothetical protein